VEQSSERQSIAASTTVTIDTTRPVTQPAHPARDPNLRHGEGASAAQNAQAATEKAIANQERQARSAKVQAERDAVREERRAVEAEKGARKADKKLEAAKAARRANR
jgi:hypothetical protein